MKRFFTLLLALALSMPLAISASAATLTPGALIKASGPAVYYFTSAGTRYVFPTEKTYKSWYTDFAGVITITDTELAAISIGGNVTYRPGTRLVKVTTDPKVYAIQGTELRWVTSEALAIELFGADWAQQVDDVPDPFFVNYTVGANITSAAAFSPTAVRNAAATIQHVIDGVESTEEPDDTEEPTDEEPAETPVDADIVLTLESTQAQSNEQIDILATASSTIGATNITLSIDGVGTLTSCNSFTCANTWTVPSAGVAASYTVRAVLTTSSGDIQEVTQTLTIVSMPVSPLAQITTNRLILKPTQFPNIRALVSTELRPSRTEIVIDDIPVKVCTDTPTDCSYIEYLTGPIGTSYDIYALVTTSDALTYKSPTITLTLADNDTPLVQLTPAKTSIFAGETVDISIAAEDDDGVNEMTIAHDETILKTCLGPVPCSVTTGPWNVSAGTTLTFIGTASDTKGGLSSTITTVSVQ